MSVSGHSSSAVKGSLPRSSSVGAKGAALCPQRALTTLLTAWLILTQ